VHAGNDIRIGELDTLKTWPGQRLLTGVEPLLAVD